MVLLAQVALPADPTSSVRFNSSFREKHSTGKTANPEALSNLLCSFSHCLSKATSTSPFNQLQNIVTQIRQRTATDDVSVIQLAINAAHTFAEQTKDSEHRKWALHLEIQAEEFGSSHSQIEIHRTPSREHRDNTCMTSGQYRWEDVICEWVARTPATVLIQSKPVLPSIPDETESDNGSDSDILCQHPLLKLSRLTPMAARSNTRTANPAGKQRPLIKGTAYDPRERKAPSDHFRSKLVRPSGLQSIWHFQSTNTDDDDDDDDQEVDFKPATEELSQSDASDGTAIDDRPWEPSASSVDESGWTSESSVEEKRPAGRIMARGLPVIGTLKSSICSRRRHRTEHPVITLNAESESDFDF